MNKKIIFLLVILFLVAAFFYFDAHEYLRFEFLQQQRVHLRNYYLAHPVFFSTLFFLIYIGITSFSIPGALVMTLAAGGIFGLWRGLVLVSFANAIGATIAFWISRYVLQEKIQQRFKQQFEKINKGMREEGNYFLFTMRVIPAVPYFIINLCMGITRIKAWSFYWITQLGELPANFIYVYAGTNIAAINKPSDILSLELLLSLSALALFPLVIKKILPSLMKNKCVTPH
jgi:uncharacterized membrane protein YdjX (TVP38/TMEM64 family)